jgi:hypothetical protein
MLFKHSVKGACLLKNPALAGLNDEKFSRLTAVNRVYARKLLSIFMHEISFNDLSGYITGYWVNFIA